MVIFAYEYAPVHEGSGRKDHCLGRERDVALGLHPAGLSSAAVGKDVNHGIHEDTVYERIEDLWPDYPTKEDFFLDEEEY